MKNIWIYYLTIIVPLFTIAIFANNQGINNSGLVISLLVYALIYRPIVDAIRLKSVSNIDSIEVWKLYIPFYGHIKYFRKLYFA